MYRYFLTIILIIVALVSSLSATTFYVSKAATTGDGQTWANAWNTIADVNSGTASGDTVFFGTGIWRDTILNIISGTYSDRTVYACSSFAIANGSGEPHFAQLWGSDSLTNWTNFSGNIYQTTWLSGISLPQLFQNDSVLWRQPTGPSGLAEGEWYYSGSTIYAYPYGGLDPDGNYDMEIAERIIVDMGNGSTNIAQDYVTIWGFRIRYANRRALDLNYIASTDNQDSVFIEHCHLSDVMGDQGGNPGLIYSGASLSTSGGRWNRVRSCLLGNCYAISPSDFRSAGNKGSGFDYYHQRYMTVDSNTFYGFFKQAAVYRKAGYSTSICDSNTFAYNTFLNTNGSGIEFFGPGWGAQIYGNVFVNNTKAIRTRFSPWNKSGTAKIYNNTFVDCENILVNGSSGDGSTPHIDNEFKFNVVYSDYDQMLGITNLSSSGGAEWKDIDRNLYFNGSGSLTHESPRYTTRSLTYWQNTMGADINSSFTTDPGFQNKAAGNYDRPSASGEMDTTYGGQRWTKYGAIQSAVLLTTPRISLSTSNLVFGSEQNGALPSSKTFTILNSGIGTLNWSVSDNATWLNLSPSSGNSNSATITATINTTNLSIGSYTAIISVNSSNADNSPKVVNVTYNVTSSTPHIAINTTTMNFVGVANASLPGAKQIVLTNTSGGTMNWTASSAATWLDVTPSSGSSNSSNIIVLVNTTAMSVGTYNATILISSSNADNSPLVVNVQYDLYLTSQGVSSVGSWTTGLVHNMGAGTERLLLFTVMWEESQAGQDRPISSITYGNRPLTLAARQLQPSFQCVEIWYLNESDIQLAQNSNFLVNWSNGQPGVSISYSAGTYDGVDQTSPISDFSTTSTSSGSPNPLTTTLSTTNGGYSVAVASHGSGSSNFTWNNGWVSQTGQADASSTNGTGDHTETTNGVTTVSVTKLNTSSSRFVLAAVGLQPSFGQAVIDTIPPATILDLQGQPQ